MTHRRLPLLVAVPIVGAALLATALVGLPQTEKTPAGRKGPRPVSTPGPQPISAPTPMPELPPPALLAQATADATPAPLELARVDVQAVIVGFLARTTTTLTFRNPHPRPLEGELVFPLPEGATVSGYALDIDGVLADGVVVEKQEARLAFESETRRRVDPGLVEWVRGNNFRTRVFPIPALGTRTIRVSYVSELATAGSGPERSATYHLPLRYPGVVGELSLRVEVDKGAAAPEVRAGGLANFRFAVWQDRFVAETRMTDARLTEDLRIALPRIPHSRTAVERHEDGEHYFVLEDFPDVASAKPTAVASADRVALFWDASLSQQDADRSRELEVLRHWLRRIGDVELRLIAFRNVPEKARSFTIRAGDTTALEQHLKALECDGGTNLAALPLDLDVAYSVLVSDGLGNLGATLPARLRAPIFALSSDPRADHAVLAHLAQRTGGSYLNLAAWTAADAGTAIGRPAPATVRAEFDPQSVADVLPSGAQAVRDRAIFAGRLLTPEARVTLHYNHADGSVHQQSFVLRRNDAGASGLVARYWAQRRVSELALAAEQNHDQLLALGQRFGIVTPGASLLVLETLEQHLAHGIEPPASRAALREAYRKQIAQRTAQRAQAKTDKLGLVVALWEQRVAWWQREFPRDVEQKRDEIVAADGSVAPQVAAGRAQETRSNVEPRPRADAERQPRRAAALPAERARAVAPSDAPDTVEGSVPGMVVGGVVGGLGVSAAPASSGMARKAKQGTDATVSTAATIAIKPWDPNTPYLTAMKASGPEGPYAVYLQQRRRHGTSPAFYLDCADFFLRGGQRALGVRVLTDIVELKLEDARLLRIAAHRLSQVGEHDLAITLFEKVRRLRPEEPQSLRDLALALAERGDARRAAKADRQSIADDYLRAIDGLNQIVEGRWDVRFAEIEIVALMEANRLVALIEREALPGRERITLDPRLRRLLDVDVRVVLTWDTDMTDMDLWVVEPTQERCYYGHRLTAIGGTISRDFTGGYGPEEYVVRRAPLGPFAVKGNFYGSGAQSLTGPTTVQAKVFTNFGRPNEQSRALTLRLTQAREIVEIGSVRFGGPAVTE